MATSILWRELEMRGGRPATGLWWDVEHMDPLRECHHTPAQTYTRRPCSCGRPLWPPHGRGRGESLTSPRRIAAKLRALDALQMVCMGYSYETIARQLGYRHRGSAYHAVQRLRDQAAAWTNFEERTGYRARKQAPTPAEIDRILATLEPSLAPYDEAQARLRLLLGERTRKARQRP